MLESKQIFTQTKYVDNTITPDTVCVCVRHITPYFTQRSNSQKKVSLMPFVTKSSVSGELNYFSLLLCGKHFERLPLTLSKAKEGKKNRRRATNLSYGKTSSSFAV